VAEPDVQPLHLQTVGEEIRGLMQHYKLIGTEWAEQFDNGCVQRRVSFWSITPNLS
jgi:hypothetical protein